MDDIDVENDALCTVPGLLITGPIDVDGEVDVDVDMDVDMAGVGEPTKGR